MTIPTRYLIGVTVGVLLIIVTLALYATYGTGPAAAPAVVVAGEAYRRRRQTAREAIEAPTPTETYTPPVVDAEARRAAIEEETAERTTAQLLDEWRDGRS